MVFLPPTFFLFFLLACAFESPAPFSRSVCVDCVCALSVCCVPLKAVVLCIPRRRRPHAVLHVAGTCRQILEGTPAPTVAPTQPRPSDTSTGRCLTLPLLTRWCGALLTCNTSARVWRRLERSGLCLRAGTVCDDFWLQGWCRCHRKTVPSGWRCLRSRDRRCGRRACSVYPPCRQGSYCRC